MHQHLALHVGNEEIVAVAVAHRGDPGLGALLSVGLRHLAALGGGVLLLDRAERHFGEVLQLDLLLQIETRGQFAGVQKCDPEQTDEAQSDQGVYFLPMVIQQIRSAVVMSMISIGPLQKARTVSTANDPSSLAVGHWLGR
jgi:hypothetical protein